MAWITFTPRFTPIPNSPICTMAVKQTMHNGWMAAEGHSQQQWIQLKKLHSYICIHRLRFIQVGFGFLQ